jgi:hypothetical protein
LHLYHLALQPNYGSCYNSFDVMDGKFVILC